MATGGKIDSISVFRTSEVGGVKPGNRSVRSCVRASEAACARETMLFPWLGDFSERVLQGARRVPFPVVGLAVPSRRFLSLLSGLNVFRMSLEVFE